MWYSMTSFDINIKKSFQFDLFVGAPDNILLKELPKTY